MKDDDSSSQTWLGTSLFDIYNGQGPWNFTTTPLIPSKYHNVLFELPVTLQGPPKPHFSSQPKHWDDDHVRMPYAPNSLFISNVKENGQEVTKPRWEVICEALTQKITNAAELEKAINSYNANLPKFNALHYFFNDVLEEEEAEHFFAQILPGIINLALQLPEILPGSLPILKHNHCRSVSLSQLQIASLLANSFLCTFLWQKDTHECFPGSNFVKLYAAHHRPERQSCTAEKLKCVCHYFKRVIAKCPVGCLTFERKFIPKSHMPRWDGLDNNLGNTKIHISSSGTIEDCHGLLQVDFANKVIGGGVLGYGCVQEEIRFVICPELIVGRLFIEQLGDNEAVTIIGSERFSNYSGYGDTFKWDGSVHDDAPFDEYGRRRTSIVVIDATKFNKKSDQFHSSAILRELNKAFVGFSSREKTNIAPVATGNWGCGAFNGDVNLKSVIQLMACSAANRNFVYFSFGNEDLKRELYNLHTFFANNRVTIGQLWRFLCRFCAAKLPQDQLYAFIQQSFFDSKSQPSIKEFFGLTTNKVSLEKPSTSTSFVEIRPKPMEAVKFYKPIEGITTRKIGSEEDDCILKSPTDFTIRRKAKIEESDKSLKSPTDVIKIIDLIDGKANKKEKSAENTSFLSEFDKLRKGKVCKNVEVEKMDVDEKMEKQNNGEEKKRKISDYFPKANNF